MNRIKVMLKKIKQSLSMLGKSAINLLGRVKKSPKIITTVLVYGVVLGLMFSYMAWQRSRLPLDIIANNPPQEQPSYEEIEIETPPIEEPNKDAVNNGENQKEDEFEEDELEEDESEEERVFKVADKIIWPIDGFREIQGRFKEKFMLGNGDEFFLDGILIPATKGSKVRAALPGVVMDVGYSYLYGNVVRIRFIDQKGDVWDSIYYNLKQIQVEEGQDISIGDSIGYVGSNLLASNFDEEHIVFELKKNGKEIDPEPYF